MKAIVFTEYGTPDVLQLQEVGKPTPKENEVLIRIYAATVNATDPINRKGEPFLSRLFTGLPIQEIDRRSRGNKNEQNRIHPTIRTYLESV